MKKYLLRFTIWIDRLRAKYAIKELTRAMHQNDHLARNWHAIIATQIYAQISAELDENTTEEIADIVMFSLFQVNIVSIRENHDHKPRILPPS